MPRNIWVAVYDIHYPKIHKPTWDAILDFVGRNSGKIAGFLFGGDQLDNEEIGHWSAGKPLFRPTGSYKANTLGFNANVLSPMKHCFPMPQKECGSQAITMLGKPSLSRNSQNFRAPSNDHCFST